MIGHEDRAGPGLNRRQRLAWLQLIRTQTIGPVTFRALINHFGTGEAALDAVPRLAERGGRRIRLYPLDKAERELAAVEEMGAAILAIGEAGYPPALRQLDDAPPLVTVLGNPASLNRPIVSIVGSRNASVAGRKFAGQLARGLGESGYVVGSGLARGIDAAAHEASIATGTVAVLAGGLDRLYPAEHADLAARIVATGGVQLTEMPLGWEARARDFPRRNRIISGVALAVVVVEAAQRSGSLITARCAAEQGRLVFAAPGSPLDPRAGGANRLIKDGAIMVTSTEDILSEIEPMISRVGDKPIDIGEDEERQVTGPLDATESDRNKIVAALGPTPIEIDEIIRFTGVRPQVVHLVLLELDLAGRLERHGGQRVSII